MFSGLLRRRISMTNAATGPAEKQARSLADLFLWWLILAIFTAAALLLPARRANAQETAGPLPAAAPSDQPPSSPRASAPAQIGGKPNISGTWALNKDESDDPREAMQQQSGNSGGHGGGGGGVHVGMGGGGMGGGGWGGGGQRGGGGSGGGGRRGGQPDSGDATNNLSQLTIEQTASSAKVTGESGDVLALYSAADSPKTNSSPAPSSGASGSGSNGSSTSSGSNSSSGASASASPAAQWQGTQLVAVTPGRREGSKTTRTYELSPDGKQLYVTTKMESPRFKKPVTFRLVYDPA
jgi:hypothetical protein